MKLPFLQKSNVRSPLSLPQTPDIAWYYEDCIRLFGQVYAGYLHDWHHADVVTPDGVKNRCVAAMRVAKAVCAEMAQLICSEGIRLNIASNYRVRKENAQDPIADTILAVFENADFQTAFPAFSERVLAEGGGAVAVFANRGDRSVTLRFYSAENFIPLCWNGSRITDARLIDRLYDGRRHYCLITRHRYQNGTARVSRTLFLVTDSGALGEETALSSVFPELESEQVFENASGPMFAYFSPAGCNNLAPQLPLGLSVYANALDTLHSLDIAFDSLRNEFLLGKKRIIVPASALRRVIDPSTGNAVRYFDNTNGVYEALNIDEEGSVKITDQTSVLRIDEHIAAINALLDILCMQTGLSYGSLSFTNGAPKTATEVVSLNSKSFRTKQLHQNAFTVKIRELVRAVFETLRAFGYIPEDAQYELAVSYADSVITDDASNEQRTLSRVNAGLQSREDAISELMGITKVQAREKLDQINSETNSHSSL